MADERMGETGAEDVRILASRPALRRLTRRSVLGGLAAAGIALVTGCGQSNGKVAANIAPDGQLESRINLYSWGDYDDPSLFTAFRKKYGAVVQADSYGSNEELMAKLSASRGTSGYDIVVPTSLYIPQMVAHRLLQPLDKSLIPNISTMDPAYMDKEFDRGNRYSVPKAYGSTGYVYDRKQLPGDHTTWADFLKLAAGPASKKTSLLEDAWEVTAIPLAVAGQSLNTTDAAQLAAARKVVVDQLAPHVKAYMGQAATAMAQGSFSLIHAYSGDARQGILDDSDPDRWQFVFPEEGGNFWGDNWCVATGAQHPDAAHRFIDWIIAPAQSVVETNYIGYTTGSKVFLNPKVTKRFQHAEIIFPSKGIMSRLTTSEYKGIAERTDILTAAQARSAA